MKSPCVSDLTDGQLVAYAKRYFAADDRMQG